MTRRGWNRSRFDTEAGDPMAPMANLIDIMLVFACGLIAALVSNGGGLDAFLQRKGESVERTRELPELPEGVGGGGGGYAPVGRVYEDPETGRLLLVK